ncbi:PREDICTED: probable LRR receptor-like serine/threonine-protein kinase At5g48740 isoform X2 [Ipomoea nil]|uniref:probable LRR receptor-like serine/threonine-protein kinase At5g48740 isoform X2 n=1 Tax=Ipomoea nil TaxID=35883 RepID=UPI000901C77D|nr:PREDICTED: probable LRR receptor-like serine/threonine-protein kinase At5g48740 isoform X2 [Ipomoea nil]
MDFHSRLCSCLLSFAVFIRFALGDQEGFLSLSCGGSISYVDSLNISWIPDGAYVSGGNTTTVDYIPDGSSSPSRLPVRFFPNSEARKCYRLPVANNVSSLVLLRTGFVYKNYDGLNTPPAFSVSLGRAITTTVNLADSDPWIEEFLWQVDKDILPICFHSFPHSGFPVVSSLELRPLPQGAYAAALGDSPNKLLRKTYRINCGYNAALRYPVDEFDRIWDADEDFSPFHVSSGVDVQTNFNNMSVVIERPPPAVLETARVLARWRDMTYTFPLDHHLGGLQGDYYVVLYFAGILPVPPTFDVLINGDVFQSNYTVSRWEVASLAFTLRGTKSLNVTLKTISYYPLLNALEVYEILDIPWETSSTTVSALQVIQQSTGLDLGWEDDPCSPITWDHLECEGNLVTSLELSDIDLRSIGPTFSDLLDLKSLDLHNTSLTGEIQNLGGLQYLKRLNLSFNELTAFGSELEDLVNLQVLDLQNNSLQGIVPDNLGELKDLHLLNLENNKLQGPLPRSLNRHSLKIRASGNLCLSFSTTFCNDFSINPSIETPEVTVLAPKKHKAAGKKKLPLIIGAVGASVLSLSLVLLAVFLYLRHKERARDPTYASSGIMDMKKWNNGAKVFSHKEIKTATNNFKQVIGRGSFGSVYVGKLPDGKQVAVKVRFDKTQLGADSFINEVCLLSQIRHQNLVSLEGFCQESKQQILVYEYLPGGSLADNLYGANSKKLTLSWVRRLKIAIDAAKGLDYLHNGSEPRIIHRDVKCSNILLDMDMNAKVSDFGLCKQITRADATHVTTVVKGTAGYLDPEYYSTRQLTEKSDVYSFGVVLLELICGREPLDHSGTPDSFNLVLWAKPYLQAGAFEIVDESIKGSYDEESMRRAALIASTSVERDALRRPNIAQVLAELKEAYSIQLSYLASAGLAN